LRHFLDGVVEPLVDLEYDEHAGGDATQYHSPAIDEARSQISREARLRSAMR
jgi:hypothetical protein